MYFKDFFLSSVLFLCDTNPAWRQKCKILSEKKKTLDPVGSWSVLINQSDMFYPQRVLLGNLQQLLTVHLWLLKKELKKKPYLPLRRKTKQTPSRCSLTLRRVELLHFYFLGWFSSARSVSWQPSKTQLNWDSATELFWYFPTRICNVWKLFDCFLGPWKLYVSVYESWDIFLLLFFCLFCCTNDPETRCPWWEIVQTSWCVFQWVRSRSKIILFSLFALEQLVCTVKSDCSKLTYGIFFPFFF